MLTASWIMKLSTSSSSLSVLQTQGLFSGKPHFAFNTAEIIGKVECAAVCHPLDTSDSTFPTVYDNVLGVPNLAVFSIVRIKAMHMLIDFVPVYQKLDRPL
mmetsp:Transcript_11082/g.24818  ORF Transcript_11082/g.24818 Transcript_11082/m.24818 type:complete len:101 (+) Transcript_11082:177-479(+)